MSRQLTKGSFYASHDYGQEISANGIKYSRLRDKFYVPVRLGAIECFQLTSVPFITRDLMKSEL